MSEQESLVVLITGAAQGIGRALATKLASMNVELILLDKQKHLLLSLSDDLLREYGIKPNLVLCDLLGATPNDYAQISESLAKEYNQIDMLILNAVHFNGLKPIQHSKIADWYNSMQVNLHANFHLIQNLLPLLLNANTSEIIMPDDSRTLSEPFWSAYSTAKAGLKALLQQISLEYTPKISTQSITIPACMTPLTRIAYPAIDKNSLITTDNGAEIIMNKSKLIKNIKSVTAS